jgi:UDP-GlcNAc:undecaprenyl-phosphate GlcNAc-1-phosphate transferase
MPEVIFYLLLFVIALVVALVLTPLTRILAFSVGAIDWPGERKLHAFPVPRLGGVSVGLACAVTVFVAMRMNGILGESLELEVWMPIFTGGSVVFVAGIWDDVRPLPAWGKFLLQAAAACLAIWFGAGLEQVSLAGGDGVRLGVLAYPFTLVWIVGVTNAFNLIDGLDGLASGLAIIAASASATVSFLFGHIQEGLLLGVMAGALLGFLPYNTSPATIFLGDSGSLLLGYTLAVTALTGFREGASTVASIPLLIFALPILDTLLSMVRRFGGGLRVLRRGELGYGELLRCAKRMFEADRHHVHHRLLALGASHHRAVLVLYATAAGGALLALLLVLARYRNAGAIALVCALAIYFGICRLYDEVTYPRPRTLLRWYRQMARSRCFPRGVIDLALMTVAYWGALLLKYELPWPSDLAVWYVQAFPIALLVHLVVLYAFGIYRRGWWTAEVGELSYVALAVSVAVMLSYVLVLILLPPAGISGFFVVQALLLGVLVVGGRSVYQVLDWLQRRDSPGSQVGEPVVIYGAGREGQLMLHALQQPDLGLCPLGFVDDDAALQNCSVGRVPVLGFGSDLPLILDRHPVAALLIASERHAGLQRAIEVCHERGVPVFRGRVQLTCLGANGTQKGLPTLRRHEEPHQA